MGPAGGAKHEASAVAESPGQAVSPRPSLVRSVLSGRMLLMLLTGFSSGLPLLLTGSTLQAWLKDEQVDLTAIGLFSLVGLPYTLKFLWSPLIDGLVPPALGRRRGWMLLSQVGVALALLGLATARPAGDPWLVAALALGVTFTSATQDIVLDAYRREILPDHELGLGSSLFVSAYRGAMLVGGALALYLADHIPWSWVYGSMAALMGVGILTTLLCPEPKLEAPPPRTLKSAVIDPFREFFQRDAPWTVLAFVLLYKIGDQMASAMTTPFVLELGFTKSEMAAMAKVFGMSALITGGIVGGALMLRLGIARALWVFGALQALSILPFAALAVAGKVYVLLGTVVVVENLCFGMGATAYTAYMASLTNKRFTGTQLALLTSLMGVPRVLIAAPTGYMAEALGWVGYFVFCAVAAIPGLALLPKVAPWSARG